MRVVIEVVSGPLAGQKFTVERGQVLRVGRTSEADVKMGDTFMSRVHFAVECGSEVCRIEDLNSRNGTLLNGADLTSAMLRDGDRIFAGQTDFVARVEGAPSQHATAPQQASTVPDVQAFQMPPTLEMPGSAAPRSDDPTPVSQPFIPPIPPEPEPPRPAQPPPSPVAKTDYGTVSYKALPAGGEAPPELRKALDAVAEATPRGRLLRALREQPEPLFALFDALHDPRLLELVGEARDAARPLYEGGGHPPEKTPYLVSLPAGSPLVAPLVERGWGKGWGVFLTSRATPEEVRKHFRQSLMLTVGGLELIFRFYEPRYLRETLRSSAYADVAKFFGPVSSYLIEGERPEMLLRFTSRGQRVETEEQLLSVPAR